MDTLPEELLFSLLYLSKYDDLINLFTTTSQFNFIRNDPYFGEINWNLILVIYQNVTI